MSVSPAQCRAARALIGWSQDQLATASKVAKATIANFEAGKRAPYDRTLDDIRSSLEAAGVEFSNGDQPGVRLKIFVDAAQPATLQLSGNSVACLTLQEAVLAWYRCSLEEQANASIITKDGKTYRAEQIPSLHYLKAT